MAEATEHLRIVISAQDQATQVIRGMSQEMNSFVSNVARGVGTGIGFAAFNQATQAIGQAFHFASDAVIGFNSSMEQSRLGWTTMLGSAEQAQAMLAQLQQFAAQTPFSFPQVEQAARRFAAMGIAAGDIVPLIRSVGEAAAAVGGGGDAINRISLALGQMSTRTRVTAEDMMQLTEVGVPAWQILAQATGQSVAQIQDAVTKGQVASDVMITAFQRFADTHWKDLLDPDTFQAIVSNIGDSATYLISQAFEPTFQGLKDLAKAFQDFVSSAGVRDFAALMRSIQVATRDFLTAVSQSGPILQVLEAAILGVAVAIGVALVPALLSAAVAAAPWLALGAALTGVALVILQNWDAVSQGTQEFAENFRQAMGQIVQFGNFLSSALTEGLNNLSTEWTTGWAAIANGFAAPINFITNAWVDFWNNSINKTGEDGFNALIAMADQGWGEFARKSVEELRFVATAWNTLVSDLQALKDVGVPLPQDLDLLAGKTIDIDKGLQSVQQGIQNVSSGAVQAGRSIGQFVAQDIPAAVAKAVETVMAAGGDLGQLIPALIKQIQDRVGGGGGGDAPALKAGQAIGNSLGQGILQGVKPLLEELARLIAQQMAGPADAAFEDAQAQLKRAQLVLADLSQPLEARQAALRQSMDLQMNVLPGLELGKFDADEPVRQLQRIENQTTLNNQILEKQRQLAGQAGGGAGVGLGGPTAVATAAPVPAPTTAALPSIQIPLQVNIIENGRVVSTYEELLEANIQASMPQTINVSAVR